VDEDEIDLDAATAEFDAETAGAEAIVGSSFAPYFKPSIGSILRFTVLYQDATNPSFVRNVCQHNGDKPLMCATGPVASAEPVEVEPGGVFSISDYKGIPFELLQGLKAKSLCNELRAMPPIADGKGGFKPRSPMFIFKTVLDSEDVKVFNERKKAQMDQANVARRLQVARENETRVNGLPVTPTSAVTPQQQQLRG